MAQKDTLEDFIRKAKATHGDKYGYSKVKYVNNTTPVEIYCKTCGIYFSQPPKLHKRHGCSDCGRRSMIEKQRKSQEQFIKDAIAIHKNKYDYSKVDYQGEKTKVIIKCNKCGHEWEITPDNLLQGYGCPECYHSKLEESVLLMLKQNGIAYEREYMQLINGHKRRYDFYLPEYNIIIECQGDQHLISRPGRIFTQTQDENQLIDIEKYKHCVDEMKYRMLYFTNKRDFKAALNISELYNKENTFYELKKLLNAIVQE